LQPNQPNPLILLLNLQRAPMAIPRNLQQIPLVVNQRQPDNNQTMLHLCLYLLDNKVEIMIAILVKSWMHALQIMLRLMNIGK